MERVDDPPIIGCPKGDWAGRSEGAFHAHMKHWHPDPLDRWLANPQDGERLADLFEAETGKRPVME